MMMTMMRMMLKMTMIMHLPMMMLASLPVVFILILLHLASNRSFSVRKILQTIIVWPPKYLDIVIVSHLTPSCPLRGISTQELLLYVRPNTIKDYFFAIPPHYLPLYGRSKSFFPFCVLVRTIRRKL